MVLCYFFVCINYFAFFPFLFAITFVFSWSNEIQFRYITVVVNSDSRVSSSTCFLYVFTQIERLGK